MKIELAESKDKNGKDTYYLILSEEEYKDLKPFLNRYNPNFTDEVAVNESITKGERTE